MNLQGSAERFLDGRTAPTVYIVARPKVDWDRVSKFERREADSWRRDPSVTDADHLVELAGRVCYMSFGTQQSPKTNAEYIAHLVRQGHESVLEHATWTFILTGVSRAFSHQLVRHRVGFSFSQLSQQYHTEEEAKFIEPSAIARDPGKQAAWREAVLNSHETYLKLISELDEGIAGAPGAEAKESRRAQRSAARAALPAGVETKIAVTANARALRHFFIQRGAIEGDEEMRVVCTRLVEQLKEEAPALFADFKIESLPDSSPIVRHVGA